MVVLTYFLFPVKYVSFEVGSSWSGHTEISRETLGANLTLHGQCRFLRGWSMSYDVGVGKFLRLPSHWGMSLRLDVSYFTLIRSLHCPWYIKSLSVCSRGTYRYTMLIHALQHPDLPTYKTGRLLLAREVVSSLPGTTEWVHMHLHNAHSLFIELCRMLSVIGVAVFSSNTQRR